MRFVLERVLDPESEPVTLAEMIEQVSEFSDLAQVKQDKLTSLIVVAREWAEEYTGRALMDQSWRISVDRTGELFPAGSAEADIATTIASVNEIFLHKSPALAITSMVTVDGDGVETTVDEATYELREADSKWPRVVPLTGAAWTAANLRITFRAGYADTTGSPQETAAEVPERFKMAIKLHAEAYYDRDQVMMDKLLAAATALIKPERVELGFA